MSKNIKVELIYFACAKDFEFEFNLCSACQIRLLTDNPDSIEALPHSLAKGVGRSQVVIITGLYSNQMIDCVAAAIGFKTSDINCEKYQITSAFAQKIIDGALPLVTTSGKYVGLILESGPQSLVLLSSDKTSRKEIMTTLIQPYIADLSRLPENQFTAKNVVEAPLDIDEPEPAEEAVVQLVEEQEDTQDAKTFEDVFSDNSLITTPEEPEEKTEYEDEDEETDLSSNAFANFNQEEFEKFKDNLYNQDTYDDENNSFVIPLENPFDDGIEETDSDTITEEPKKKKSGGILTIILLVILFVLLGFIVFTLVIEPIIKGVPLLKNLTQIFGFLLQ